MYDTCYREMIWYILHYALSNVWKQFEFILRKENHKKKSEYFHVFIKNIPFFYYQFNLDLNFCTNTCTRYFHILSKCIFIQLLPFWIWELLTYATSIDSQASLHIHAVWPESKPIGYSISNSHLYIIFWKLIMDTHS